MRVSLGAAVILLIGSIFVFLSSLGMLRMPDPLSRLQAATKSVTLGNLLVLFSSALMVPSFWWKFLLIAVFVLITSPVSASTLSRVAYLKGFARVLEVDQWKRR